MLDMWPEIWVFFSVQTKEMNLRFEKLDRCGVSFHALSNALTLCENESIVKIISQEFFVLNYFVQLYKGPKQLILATPMK